MAIGRDRYVARVRGWRMKEGGRPTGKWKGEGERFLTPRKKGNAAAATLSHGSELGRRDAEFFLISSLWSVEQIFFLLSISLFFTLLLYPPSQVSSHAIPLFSREQHEIWKRVYRLVLRPSRFSIRFISFKYHPSSPNLNFRDTILLPSSSSRSFLARCKRRRGELPREDTSVSSLSNLLRKSLGWNGEWSKRWNNFAIKGERRFVTYSFTRPLFDLRTPRSH